MPPPREHRHLTPVQAHRDHTSVFDGDSPAQLLSAAELLLGALVEKHVETAVRVRGGRRNVNPQQLTQLRRAARRYWLQLAHTPDTNTRVAGFRNLARGAT